MRLVGGASTNSLLVKTNSLSNSRLTRIHPGMRVVAGTNELQKAYRTQKKTRRRMCCMLVSGMCPPMSSFL